MSKRAKFRVGQVVRVNGGPFVKIVGRTRDEDGFDWYKFEEIFDVRSDDELRPLTRREKGER